MPLSICNHNSHKSKPIIVSVMLTYVSKSQDGWRENYSMLKDTETGVTHNIKLSTILTFLVWNVLWFPLLMQQHIQMRISHGSFHVPPVPVKVLPLQSSHVCSTHTPLQHVTAARTHMQQFIRWTINIHGILKVVLDAYGKQNKISYHGCTRS